MGVKNHNSAINIWALAKREIISLRLVIFAKQIFCLRWRLNNNNIIYIKRLCKRG